MNNCYTSLERARQYLAKLPAAVSGQRGHATTFHAACVLIQGFALPQGDGLALLREYNNRCQPPWSEADLQHKIRSAMTAPARKGWGYLLKGASRPVAPPSPAKQAHSATVRPLPNRSGFGKGSVEQLRSLSQLRQIGLEGLEWAQERGLLVFGSWHGIQCFGVTDQSGRVLEIRRLDGQQFPVFGELKERKSHAVKGSQKAWPVGIIESKDFQSIALLEGVPDFLACHYLAWCEEGSKDDLRCAPVAMLSASPTIGQDALPYFRGKAIRIFPHFDGDGWHAAEYRWKPQLLGAGASKVDIFDLSGLRRSDGKPVNDLCDLLAVDAEEFHNDSELWRILP